MNGRVFQGEIGPLFSINGIGKTSSYHPLKNSTKLILKTKRLFLKAFFIGRSVTRGTLDQNYLKSPAQFSGSQEAMIQNSQSSQMRQLHYYQTASTSLYQDQVTASHGRGRRSLVRQSRIFWSVILLLILRDPQ